MATVRVGGEGVEDVDVVGPGDRGEAGGQILLLVAGEDEDGDHLEYGTSFAARCGGREADPLPSAKDDKAYDL
jgi:hypothetical protein